MPLSIKGDPLQDRALTRISTLHSRYLNSKHQRVVGYTDRSKLSAQEKIALYLCSPITCYLFVEPVISQYQSNFLASILGYLVFAICLIFYFGTTYYILTSRIHLKSFIPDLALFLYIIVCSLSSWKNATGILISMQSILYEVKYIFVFLSIIKLKMSRNSIDYYLKVLTFVLTFELLVGYMQLIGGYSFRELFYQNHKFISNSYLANLSVSFPMVGTILAKNYFASSLLWLFLLIYLKINYHNHLKSASRICIAILSFTGIFLSQAKAVILILFLFVFYKCRKHPPIYIFLTTAILLLTWFNAWDSTPISKLFQPDYYEIVEEFGRIALVRATFEVLREAPLLGLGGGNWGLAISLKDTGKVYDFYEAGSYYLSKGVMMDNNWASIVGQFGLLGLGSFIIFILILLKFFLSTSRERNIPIYNVNIANYCTLLLLSSSLLAFFYPIFTSKSLMFAHWTVLGFCYSYLSQVGKADMKKPN